MTIKRNILLVAALFIISIVYGVTGDDNNGADTIDGDYIGEIRRDGVGYAPTGELGVPSQPMLNIKAWMKATPAVSFALATWSKKKALLKCKSNSKQLSAELEALTRLHNDARMHKWIKRAGEQSVLKKLHTYEVENGVCIVYPFITGKSILDHFGDKSWDAKAKELPFIVTQGLKALQYLHELGIIHRDIWHKNIMITPATKGNPVKLTIIDYDRSEFLDTNAFLPLDTWRRLLNKQNEDVSQLFVTIFTTMLRVQFDDNSVAAIKDYVNKAGRRLQQMKIHGYENWRPPFNSPITNGDNYNRLSEYLPDPTNLDIARSLVPFFTMLASMHNTNVSEQRPISAYLRYFKSYYKESWLQRVAKKLKPQCTTGICDNHRGTFNNE